MENSNIKQENNNMEAMSEELSYSFIQTNKKKDILKRVN
jgi:hypothetical protein